MSKRNWFAATALGLVAGVAIALLFLVWAVPEFRNPSYQKIAQETTTEQNGTKEANETDQKSQWRYWAERLIGMEDTPAQWLMAFFAVLATGVSVYGIRLLKQTLDATREVGRGQSRAYVHVEQVKFTWGDRNGTRPRFTLMAMNTGQTPARWFECNAIIFTRPLDEFGLYAEPIEFADIERTTAIPNRWNALGGGQQLSFLAGAPYSSVATEAYGKDNVSLDVAGTLRYETFFGKIFETDFWFVCRPPPTYSLDMSKADPTGMVRMVPERAHTLQRASGNLRTYHRVTTRS